MFIKACRTMKHPNKSLYSIYSTKSTVGTYFAFLQHSIYFPYFDSYLFSEKLSAPLHPAFVAFAFLTTPWLRCWLVLGFLTTNTGSPI